MSRVARPSEPNSSPTMPHPQKANRPLLRMLGIILILISVLLGWFLIVGYLGWLNGQSLRDQQLSMALNEQIDRQKELARNDIENASYNLALLRLEWVLEQRPGDNAAKRMQSEAQEALEALISPTPSPRATVGPTATPLPTATPGPIGSPEAEIQRIQRLMAMKLWAEAIPVIVNFQREFPSYERYQTDQYLYDAYLELGLDLINGEDVERGMLYLAQAAKLGDLPQSVLDYETWAELYLQGVAFYGANWDAAAYYFRDLCLAAPFYQSSCDRLREVLIFYGDQQVSLQDWCPAVPLYEEAAQHGNSPSLSEKLAQAREMCLLATPTPDLMTPESTPEDEPVENSFRFETPTAVP